MDLGISGRTALVLGASGGLGSAIAARLAAEGAAIAAAGRSADALAATAARVEAAGVKALPLVWDLGDLDRLESVVAAVEQTLGPVDILVNNTGGPPPTTVAGQDAATWRTGFEQMILSVIMLTDRVLPGMRAAAVGPDPHIDVVGRARRAAGHRQGDRGSRTAQLPQPRDALLSWRHFVDRYTRRRGDRAGRRGAMRTRRRTRIADQLGAVGVALGAIREIAPGVVIKADCGPAGPTALI